VAYNLGGIPVPGGNVTISRSVPPPFVMTPAGGGQAALNRAAQITSVASSQTLPPLRFSTAGCASLGGSCTINPANGALLLQMAPPTSDAFTIVPVLSFNSTDVGTVSEVGNGWSHLFRRYVSAVVPTPPGAPGSPRPGPPPPGPSGPPTVITGAGQNYSYASTISGGYQTPTSNAVNSLSAGADWSSFTET
jgi:hypothetical protein